MMSSGTLETVLQCLDRSAMLLVQTSLTRAYMLCACTLKPSKLELELQLKNTCHFNCNFCLRSHVGYVGHASECSESGMNVATSRHGRVQKGDNLIWSSFSWAGWTL